MLGKLKDLNINHDGTMDMIITVDTDVREMFEELHGGLIDVQIKKHYKKRSLDANALCWYMIDQIAAKAHKKKSEVYREAIRDIGGVSTVVCTLDENVDAIIKSWVSRGEGWQAIASPSKLPGCSNLTLICGSSVYDSAQMSSLIDSLIQDAESLDIPPPSRKEIDRAKEIWNRKKEKENVTVTSTA